MATTARPPNYNRQAVGKQANGLIVLVSAQCHRWRWR